MATAAEPRPVLSAARKLWPVPAFGSSSEFDLLLACCAACGDEGGERIRNILSRPLDWERVLRLVDHHRVVPQMYSELSALSRWVPVQHLNALRLRYQDNARKTLWFTGNWFALLA